MVKTYVYINMECLHYFLSREKGIWNTGSNWKLFGIGGG